MKACFCGLMFLAALGAAPATRPATQPAATQPAFDELRSEMERARTEKKAATVECLTRLEASAAYKTAVAELDRKQATLNQTRKAGTSQEKLDASAAMVKARQRVTAMRTSAIVTDKRLHEADHQLSILVASLDEKQKAARREQASQEHADAEAAAKDPIRRAIKEHRLTVGMTLEQAREAMKWGGYEVLISERSDGSKTYRWTTSFIWDDDGKGGGKLVTAGESVYFYATVINGKVVDVDRSQR